MTYSTLKTLTEIALLGILLIPLAACDNNGKTSTKNQVLQCAVKDQDINQSYTGECKNGFAHGFGTARGRDTYTGHFKNGLTHGQGKYEWGPNSDWADEQWEGAHYKGNRTGYGVLTIGKKSKQFITLLGDYSSATVMSDGRRQVHGIWIRGKLSKSEKCRTEADCFLDAARIEAAIKPVVEKAVQRVMKDRVFTLTELLLPFTPKGKAPNQIYLCLALENIEIYKETTGRVLVDAHDMSNMIKIAMEPRHLLSTVSECNFKVQNNEDFVTKLSPYQDIEVTELRASLKWLNGQKVRISGHVISIMNNFVFKDGPTDMNPILLNTQRTSRKVILQAMENCSMNAVHGCSAVIAGTVMNSEFGAGIALEEIQIQKKAQEGVY